MFKIYRHAKPNLDSHSTTGWAIKFSPPLLNIYVEEWVKILLPHPVRESTLGLACLCIVYFVI